MSGPNIKSVSALLNDRVIDVLAHLGIGGKIFGDMMSIASAMHGDDPKKPKLSVRISGEKKGQWIHWVADERGDLLDLVAVTITGRKDRSAAYKWALDFLGLAAVAGESKAQRAARQEAIAQRAAIAARRQRLASIEADKKLAKARTAAMAIWLKGRPLTASNQRELAVGRYLLARGIDLSKLARAPRAIRVLEKGEDGSAHRDVNTGVISQWPVMLVMMSGADGSIGAVHRTWVDPENLGKKAPVDPPRKMWPAAKGCTMRLWRGAGGKIARDAAPHSELVLVCEGVEDALSLALIAPEARIEAAGSVTNMANYMPPASASEVRICADADWDKPAAKAALARAVAQIKRNASAARVHVVWPPSPHQDWNDALLATLATLKNTKKEANNDQ